MIAVDIRGLDIPWDDIERDGFNDLAAWVAARHPERVTVTGAPLTRLHPASIALRDHQLAKGRRP